jgi:hypothetical protein
MSSENLGKLPDGHEIMISYHPALVGVHRELFPHQIASLMANCVIP